MKMHGGCSRDMRMHELYVHGPTRIRDTYFYVPTMERGRNRLFRRFIYTYIYMFDIFYIFQNLRYQ